jgi:hypothetical protein
LQVQPIQKKMTKLTKKVERLRAVLLTKKQSEELIKNIDTLGDYNDEDKTLMENFKKIYHVGVKQLKVFIDLLNEMGKKIDEYSITYYTTQLKNGPLKSFLSSLVSDKPYWGSNADIIGTQGNLNRSATQTPIHELGETAVFDQSVVTLNKLPGFAFEAYTELTDSVNKIYKANILGSLDLDSTLRGRSFRYANDEPHGEYIVADTTSWNNTRAASDGIYNEIKTALGDENYRMYTYNKLVTPFNSDINTSVSTQYVVHHLSEYKSLGETKSVILSTDLVGNVFEYTEPRKFELEIKGESNNTKLKLHTVQGQLGSVSKLKEEPITEG